MHSPWGDALRTRDRWRAVSPASRNGSGRGGTRARCLFNRRSCPSRRTRCARLFFFSSRRQHTRCGRDWSSDVCSSDLDAFEIVLKLWDAPQRELHYFAQELFFKYKQQFEVSDISVIECLIGHNAWWDTVDFIATKPLAFYFKKFPDQREKIVQKWLSTGDIWFQRSALLFQLKYKTETDLELMSSTILTLKDSKEFFIKKAIGWILREYSRTDAQWVLNFVNQNELQALSKREAIRLIQTQ